MTIDEAMQIAVQHHQGWRLSEAEGIYRQILAQQPNHADALHLLGLIACQSGHPDAGVDLIRRAIAVNPNWHVAYNNLGNALSDKGQLGEAIIAYRQAVALKPDSPETQGKLGNALRGTGQLAEAIAAYRQAIAHMPNWPEVHIDLGNALKDKGQLDQAIAAYRQAIALKPNYPQAYNNLGNALGERGLLDESAAAYRQAIALNPGMPEVHMHLGNTLKSMGRLDEAIAAHRQAIALNPNLAEAYVHLGYALTLSSVGRDSSVNARLEEAIAALRKAIELKPACVEAHIDLGYALASKGQPGEAVAAVRQAIALKPDYAEAHHNLALILLLLGDFPQGWAEHEWRWKIKNFPSTPWSYAQPQWDGSELTDRTLLLHAEQGLGDNIQFIRYLPLAAQRCRRIVVSCPPQLRRLFQSVPGAAQWVTPDHPLPPFDTHCPLLSLPMVFGTTVDSIPASVPYVKADSATIERWRERLDGNPAGLKVGIAWAGTSTHKNDANRSIPLSFLAPLRQAEGVAFYSLQKGDASEQVKKQTGLQLTDWTPDLIDFADTAALAANLDLVISVDTSVAHLAGALGKPVWLLLPFVPDWRWLRNREDSPWYPTLRLFRQPAIGDWDSVIKRVAAELRGIAGRSE